MTSAFSATVTGYSVDSRTIAPGDLFIALRGPNHDGHDHVEKAFAAGAAAAIVEQAMPGNCIVVRDSLAGAATTRGLGAPALGRGSDRRHRVGRQDHDEGRHRGHAERPLSYR